MTQSQTRSQNWAYLKEGTPFNEIFPDRQVPIRSILPIIPREEGSPPCYVVDADFLNSDQIDCLSQKLFEMWRPECDSVEQAKDYIRRGLPLKVDWFNGVGSSSVLFGLMDDEEFMPEQEDDDDNDDDDYFDKDEFW